MNKKIHVAEKLTASEIIAGLGIDEETVKRARELVKRLKNRKARNKVDTQRKDDK